MNTVFIVLMYFLMDKRRHDIMNCKTFNSAVFSFRLSKSTFEKVNKFDIWLISGLNKTM